jgi:hypothetical protein
VTFLLFLAIVSSPVAVVAARRALRRRKTLRLVGNRWLLPAPEVTLIWSPPTLDTMGLRNVEAVQGPIECMGAYKDHGCVCPKCLEEDRVARRRLSCMGVG